ncbi:MAG: recombination protein RecR [Planctomycetota bacterium]|jgi:recombination protein RecR|nr:MAG: recombination protein RecR [Planctomycetota bacterium]
MSNAAYPDSVRRLIEAFAAMPGIGRRTAERLAFHVLRQSPEEALELARAVQDVKKQVKHCSICWSLADADPCPICKDPRRDATTVLVVEQPKDLLVMEKTGLYRGVYHVLLGRLDPLGGMGPESITIDALLVRLDQPARNSRGEAVTEIILGLNPDLEGDTTALWIAREAGERGIRSTRLARGLPSGSQLEFANPAVIGDALKGRTSL